MKVLGDNAKLEIKAEMLNFFNFTNIDPATIQGDIENQSFGQASNALGARTIDFQARFNF
jgi:hypothetical protein